MDFSQNLTIPSVTSSLRSVFDVFYENAGVQSNYLYDEFTNGKGSVQVNRCCITSFGRCWYQLSETSCCLC